nr:hypothetical protein [Tanacetum cinerariifolium]
MGDESPIRTLGDYSKPSHESYMNTIELPVENNMAISKRARSTRGKPPHLAKKPWTKGKETTNRVTEIDLSYLYCIFGEEVVCNIPYWLAKYLKSVWDKSVIFRGMFVIRIAQSFGLLTNEMVKGSEGDDEEGNGEGGNKGVGGFADIYRNISQGD